MEVIKKESKEEDIFLFIKRSFTLTMSKQAMSECISFYFKISSGHFVSFKNLYSICSLLCLSKSFL